MEVQHLGEDVIGKDHYGAASGGPAARYEFPPKEIVHGGFLELVRYGIHDAHDPII